MGCGICGFVGLDDRNLLLRMCRTLVHRGPDEEGTYIDSKVGLGVRRLSIIDLATGSQPLHNEDHTVTTIFNGEIYNYIEIRDLLRQRNHHFSTNSDTEVIAHAYEEWALDFPSKLRGMFAIALWDAVNQRLVLVRDRFGKKPLFYTVMDGIFLFASEIKALLQLESLPLSMNRRARELFFVLSYIPYPYTIFTHVSKLPPASMLVLEKGDLHVTQYWDLDIQSRMDHDEDTLLELMHRLLSEAVEIRLKSDVPLGAFLSGGLDSSTIVAAMAKSTSTPVRTFTVGFDDESYSETPFARQVAEFLGTDHHELVVKADAVKILPKLVWHFDEPFADASAIPTYYVSEACGAAVKVALTGDGGDEVFMGYSRINDIVLQSPPGEKRSFVSNVARDAAKRLGQHRLKKLIPRSESIRRLRESLLTEGERYLSKSAIVTPTELPSLLAGKQENVGNEYIEVVDRFLQRTTQTPDRLKAVYYVTMKLYLAEDILTKVDRMSMANSLEIRSPFLDHEFAGTMATVPSGFKATSENVKLLLRKYLARHDLLPKAIIERQKRGFGVPFGLWFSTDFEDFAKKVVYDFADSGHFSSRFVEGLFRDPATHARRIYALMVYALWHKMYVDSSPTHVPSFDINRYL